ncbi:MAG: tRNA dihydrouridine synthase DusB [Endomicrobium sp.]|jgi:tRNA-dihydrouridine synthase B|nr:tRNA dihydrouridine synthase DusB [Endomicrobium sp.]
MKKLIIGKIELNNNILLAPMAGITDLPLRLLAKRGGAGLVYTEMVSSKALVHNDKKTKRLLKILDEERPVAAQIFGNDSYSMAEAAKIVRDMGADIVDLNLGCPVRKITSIGAGVKLLADEKNLVKILESVVKSVDIPVTIKIRTGFLTGQCVASKIVKTAQNCGIKMVAVHARCSSQRHKGNPDLEAFANACYDSEIPVVANGGIVDEKTASDFLKISNCAGIMIGRGAIGNYSIFNRLEKFFSNSKMQPLPSKKEKIEWLKQHAKYSIEHYGEKKGLVVMRKVTHYYVKDLPNAAKIRSMLNMTISISDFNELIKFI